MASALYAMSSSSVHVHGVCSPVCSSSVGRCALVVDGSRLVSRVCVVIRDGRCPCLSHSVRVCLPGLCV